MIMGGMLITGSCNTLVLKWQDQTKVGDGDETYNHPFFQCLVMFIGEFCCLGLYGIKLAFWNKKKDDEALMDNLSPEMKNAENGGLKTNINPLLLAIPASCDICGSTLMFIALTMVAASVYQMMRGVIVVITALLAVIFLGKKLYLHHWLSLAAIVIGITIVGAVSMAYATEDYKTLHDGKEPDGEASTSSLGIILLLSSQCFAGAQFISEEKLLGDYVLDPFKVVGLEGMWGTLYYLILLPIFQNVSCSADMCVNGHIEDSVQALQ
jgi:drug/metabolite transporter (DMT)-like permease